MYKPNFKVGDVIDFCGEWFRVLTTGATQGTVEYLDGEYVGKIYWEYNGSRAKLVTQEQVDEIRKQIGIK